MRIKAGSVGIPKPIGRARSSNFLRKNRRVKVDLMLEDRMFQGASATVEKALLDPASWSSLTNGILSRPSLLAQVKRACPSRTRQLSWTSPECSLKTGLWLWRVHGCSHIGASFWAVEFLPSCCYFSPGFQPTEPLEGKEPRTTTNGLMGFLSLLTSNWKKMSFSTCWWGNKGKMPA